MQGCIFCKIINKEISSEIIYEDDDFIVVKDINPFGPVALLIFPKEHISTIIDLEGRDDRLSALFNLAIKIAREYNLDSKGFSFHINGGGVQEVNHLHLKIGGAWENKNSNGFPKW